jgi:hypothetical protein
MQNLPQGRFLRNQVQCVEKSHDYEQPIGSSQSRNPFNKTLDEAVRGSRDIFMFSQQHLGYLVVWSLEVLHQSLLDLHRFAHLILLGYNVHDPSTDLFFLARA